MPRDHHDKKFDNPGPGTPVLSSGHADAATPIRYTVAELLRGGREAVLEHGGAEYRLRVTANGRLILTK